MLNARYDKPIPTLLDQGGEPGLPSPLPGRSATCPIGIYPETRFQPPKGNSWKPGSGGDIDFQWDPRPYVADTRFT